MIKRRGIEEFSISFLDVICCGFGAVILLLMLTRPLEPILLENSEVDLSERIKAREETLFEIRGEIRELLASDNASATDRVAAIEAIKELERQLEDTLGKATSLGEAEREIDEQTAELASAKQTLTDEMQRLLGLDFKRDSGLVGGIAVDSEYIIFVIDTSGSMQSAAWNQVVRKVDETLSIYPRVKGIQIMNDMGDYMFPQYRGTWLEDGAGVRNRIIQTLSGWAPFSNSSPVEGIREAIDTYYDPSKNISIYVFGDDYTGDSVEEVVDVVDQINIADEMGRRRVRIHAVGFPVYLDQPNARIYRFAALMRELAYRNDGTFVGLTEYR